MCCWIMRRIPKMEMLFWFVLPKESLLRRIRLKTAKLLYMVMILELPGYPRKKTRQKIFGVVVGQYC